jgi:single-strand DNA-binding protein
MARGINKVILVGNVGEVETRYTQQGLAVTKCSIATGKEWKDKNTGEKKSRTEWHQCVAFEPQSLFIGEYVKKGFTLYIEGELQTQKWDKDGEVRYATRVIVDTVEIMRSPREKNGEAQSGAEAAPPELGASGNEPNNSFDDDIPF